MRFVIYVSAISPTGPHLAILNEPHYILFLIVPLFYMVALYGENMRWADMVEEEDARGRDAR